MSRERKRSCISIHSPRARGDARWEQSAQTAEDFNPLPSCEGRPGRRGGLERCRIISIHSPRARGDAKKRDLRVDTCNFNPLPSCEGRRIWAARRPGGTDFNPLPSCEGRRDPRARRRSGRAISIHSPRARGDNVSHLCAEKCHTFQSTPLVRGETRTLSDGTPVRIISIHSPRARGDHSSTRGSIVVVNFNPLPSCEGRRLPTVTTGGAVDFNPLPSCEGRPVRLDFDRRTKEISIHSPRARGDRRPIASRPDLTAFQSTPLVRGETFLNQKTPCARQDFNPLPSCEGRRKTKSFAAGAGTFQSTPLVRGETIVFDRRKKP